jgi:hypothetical protein
MSKPSTLSAKRWARISIFGLAAAITTSEAFAACVAPFRFQLTSQGPWPAFGSIKSGSSCSGSFSSSGPIIFKRLLLASAPQHGAVRLQQGGRYFYSPSAGYVGKDNFTLKVCGNQGGFEGCADIAYAMTIQ